MARISLVTGGANSGKSKFAEDLCLGLDPSINGQDKVLYIASAKVLDDEMAEKKAKHIERRMFYGWDTLEAYKDFDQYFADKSILDTGYKSILFDCLTMMVTNVIFEGHMDFDASDKDLRREKEDLVFRELDKLLDLVADQDLDLVFVTNELGMGLVGDSSLSRYFQEVAGRVNKYIGDRSQTMYFVVSGQPIRVK